MTPVKLTKSDIIQQLRQYQSQGMNLCAHGQIKKRDPNFVAAIRRRFGSYAQCMKAMGIDYQPIVIRSAFKNGDMVLDEIRRYQRQGQDFSYNHMTRIDQKLVLAGKRYFGSWGQALEAAGISYEQVQCRPKTWTREKIIERLVQLRDAGVDMSTMSMIRSPEHRNIYVAAKKHFGGYPAGLKAAGIEHVKRTPAIYKDAQAVLDGIAARRRNGKDITYKQVFREDTPLVRAAKRYLGSWKEALEKAGIDYDRITLRQNWDRDRIVAELRELHRRGRNLTPVRLRQRHDTTQLLRASSKYFGSYADALKAAGIDYDAIPGHWQRWDKQRILDTIRELQSKGEDLSHSAVEAKHLALYRAACIYLDGWREAIETAGLDYATIRKPLSRKWTSEKIIQMLQKLHARGRDLHSSKVPVALYRAATTYFESYQVALAAAGIELAPYEPKWPEEKILQTLRSMHKAGKDISHNRLRKVNESLFAAAKRHFGSYHAAIEAAGIDYGGVAKRSGHWTEATILQRLREMDEAGEDLRDRSMKARYQSLYWAAKKWFGTYVNAVQQAGIDYDRAVQRALKMDRAHAKASS